MALKFEEFTYEDIMIKDNNFVYMGIDQSMVNTGITVIKDSTEKSDLDNIPNMEVLYANGIKTSSANSLEVRISYILENIEYCIDKYNPFMVSIEGLAFGKFNTNNGRVLAGLFFNILNLLFNKEIPYKIIPPTSLKKQVTSSGSASKEDMKSKIDLEVIKKLEDISNIKSDSKRFEDIVDSYWLAINNINKLKESKDLYIKGL